MGYILRVGERRKADLFDQTFDQRLKAKDGAGYSRLMTALDGVKRWENGRQLRKPLKESVYEHTMSMLQRFYRMVDECPEVARVVIIQDVEAMIMFHDTGEIEEGDTTLTAQTEELNKIREIKELNSARRILPTLLSIEDAQMAVENVERYENRKKNPNDKESRLVKFIDVIDGSFMALAYMYRITFSDQTKTESESKEVKNLSIDRMIVAANDFISAINAGNDGDLNLQLVVNKVWEMVSWELVTYCYHGYWDEVYTALQDPANNALSVAFKNWGIEREFWDRGFDLKRDL